MSRGEGGSWVPTGQGGRRSGRMRSVSGVGRIAALGAVIAAIALVAIVMFGGAGAYSVKAEFINAGQLVRGNPVQIGGVPVGSVGAIKITANGQAEITLKIKDDHAPLPEGTQATIRQFSLSGIANRYVDLRLPNGRGTETIADGGAHRRRGHAHRGRPRPALQHARPRDAQEPAGLLQGPGPPVRRPGRAGEQGARVPEPGAGHVQPPVQRADAGHARARAVPRRQVAARDRPRRAPRRPRRPRRQPQRHHPRARRPEGRAGGVDRAAARRSCAGRTRPS